MKKYKGILVNLNIWKAASTLALACKYFNNQMVKIQQIERAYCNARKILNDDSFFEKGLSYFKNRYEESQFKYPGADVYYNLLCDCARLGLTVEETYKTSIEIIDYEFIMLNNSYSIGGIYHECYNSTHPILKAIQYKANLK